MPHINSLLWLLFSTPINLLTSADWLIAAHFSIGAMDNFCFTTFTHATVKVLTFLQLYQPHTSPKGTPNHPFGRQQLGRHPEQINH